VRGALPVALMRRSMNLRSGIGDDTRQHSRRVAMLNGRWQ
jgi:hypothetical protein